MAFPLSDVLVPVGTRVQHRQWGWVGRVGYGSAGSEVMVIWDFSGGASFEAYENLEVTYPEEG